MHRILNIANQLLYPRHQGDKLRVLVAEDHPDLSRMITLILSHCGFDALAVLDGLKVIPTARAFRPHFILLDIGLPGLSGYEVAEQIRKDTELRNVTLIAISAYGPNSRESHERQACFDHFLTKPVDIESILPLLVLRQN